MLPLFRSDGARCFAAAGGLQYIGEGYELHVSGALNVNSEAERRWIG